MLRSESQRDQCFRDADGGGKSAFPEDRGVSEMPGERATARLRHLATNQSAGHRVSHFESTLAALALGRAIEYLISYANRRPSHDGG